MKENGNGRRKYVAIQLSTIKKTVPTKLARGPIFETGENRPPVDNVAATGDAKMGWDRSTRPSIASWGDANLTCTGNGANT